MGEPWQFADETESAEEIAAALRKDPVVNAWRIRTDAQEACVKAQIMCLRARIVCEHSLKLQEIHDLRLFLRR